jgi:FdhE protein
MSEPRLPGGGADGEIPYLRPHPGAAAFRRRADRLAELAPGHAAGDFLAFAGRLAAAQAAAAGRLRLPPPAPGLPAARPLDLSAGPPPAWREALALLAADLARAPMPAPARAALEALGSRGGAELDALAGRLLGGELGAADLAPAPFAGAALQVVHTLRAAALPPGAVARAADAGCPVCGFAPVAGVVLPEDRLRYLVCGLCASEWHLTRVQCALCRSAERLSYLVVEGAEGPAKAEVCDGCRAYTKLLYREKAPGLEPFADDLATLALDLLVGERGYAKHGRNPYLASAAE